MNSVEAVSSEAMQRPASWTATRPWQTNAALSAIGFAMLCLTQQFLRENDGFTFGFAALAGANLVLFAAAILILLLHPGNTDRWTFPIIVTVAVLCRLTAIFPDPFQSSDVYRYAWDGVVQHAHINPYRYVPGDPALTFLRAPNRDLFESMNRRDYARTIYPPVAQMVFYLITFISPTVIFMKMALVLFEGLTLWGLVRLLDALGYAREWTIVYAWFPMLIWEFGSSGHLDSVVIAFVVLAFLFRFRRQPVLTGLFLGLAVLTKFYPLVLFPALYQRGDWKMPATMAALTASCYAIYLSVGKLVLGFLPSYAKEEGVETGQRFFLLDLAEHHWPSHHIPNLAFYLFSALVFGLLMLWSWRTCSKQQSDPKAFLAPALGFAMALMLLFSPHYPWYVAWLVPFLVLMPSLTVLTYIGVFWYLCNTSLAVGTGPLQYHLNEILYSSVLLAFIIGVTLRRLPQTREWFRHPMLQRSGEAGHDSRPRFQ